MSLDEEIVQSVKRYVQQESSFQEANRIVQKHKKLQEKIKALYQEKGISSFVLNKDGYSAKLEFKDIKTSRVDISKIPEHIRNAYIRETIMKKENLVIYTKPEN